MVKICKYCGSEFIPRVRNSMEYCSIECRNKASGRIRYQSGKIGICRVCGKEFIKSYGNERICSDECRDEMIRQNKHKYYKKKYVPTPKETHGQCAWCGAETNGNMYCSKECEEKAKWKRIKTKEFGSWELYQEEQQKKKDEIQRAKEEKQRAKEARRRTGVCIVCGETFSTLNPAQKTCSKECGKKYERARKQRRIPKEQIKDKDITLEAIYRRDSGVCYLCGGVCDWDDKKKETNTCGSTYPSIDHLVPVSKGGLHSWENVRLAHLACNIAKSDSIIDDIESLIPKNAREYERKNETGRGYKKRVAQVTRNGDTLAIYPSTLDAEKSTGFHSKGIQKCARGEYKSYRGYLWKYMG